MAVLVVMKIIPFRRYVRRMKVTVSGLDGGV
jgi:hypothetical protein